MVISVITNLILDSSKASGADCIPVVVLKNCESELSYILAEFFNQCLKESCFSDYWQVSSVVSVFKTVGERFTAKNYHPVSLFSVVSKVLEKLVNNKIVDHLKKCGLFFISSVVLGLLDQLQIFSQLYLIELLGIFVRSYLSCSSWCIQGFWHGLASWSPQTLGLWCFRSDIWHYFYFFLVIGRFKWFWMVFTRISS